LFENINHIPQMLRQYIPLHNIRRRIHHFVLVGQLGVDPVQNLNQTDAKPENIYAHTLCNV